MTGVTLPVAQGISDDGSVITGRMRNTSGQQEAYLAIYDTRVAGMIAAAGSANSVDGVSALSRGTRGQGDAGLRQMTQVARHYALPEVSEVSVTRGFGGSAPIQYGAFGFGDGLWGEDSPAGQAKTAAATVGLMGQSNAGLRFGLGVQTAGLDRTDGYLGSSVEADGYGGVAFVAYQPEETGLRVHASATVLKLGADIDRNYMNGTAVETARGSTDGTYVGLEIELGYAFQMNDAQTVSPFAACQYSKAKFDGYTETGETFGGAISDQSSTNKAVKLGVQSGYQVSDGLELTGSVAEGRVSESQTAAGLGVTAQSGMQFGGASGDREYSVGYLSIGANYQLSSAMHLYGNIERQRAFDSAASDIDAVTASVGMSFGF